MRSLFALVLVCCIIAALGFEQNVDSTKELNGLLDRMSSNLEDLIQSAGNLRGLTDERLEKMIEQSDQLVLKLYDALENAKA